ncbi:MAG: hypothetical protein GWP59_00110 [Chlamydiales bacterium]|nr:hypothetical protein [Chlamydiales bacterium]
MSVQMNTMQQYFVGKIDDKIKNCSTKPAGTTLNHTITKQGVSFNITLSKLANGKVSVSFAKPSVSDASKLSDKQVKSLAKQVQTSSYFKTQISQKIEELEGKDIGRHKSVITKNGMSVKVTVENTHTGSFVAVSKAYKVGENLDATERKSVASMVDTIARDSGAFRSLNGVEVNPFEDMLVGLEEDEEVQAPLLQIINADAGDHIDGGDDHNIIPAILRPLRFDMPAANAPTAETVANDQTANQPLRTLAMAGITNLARTFNVRNLADITDLDITFNRGLFAIRRPGFNAQVFVQPRLMRQMYALLTQAQGQNTTRGELAGDATIVRRRRSGNVVTEQPTRAPLAMRRAIAPASTSTASIANGLAFMYSNLSNCEAAQRTVADLRNFGLVAQVTDSLSSFTSTAASILRLANLHSFGQTVQRALAGSPKDVKED